MRHTDLHPDKSTLFSHIIFHKAQEVFLKYRPLLKELVARDLKVRYRHSILGMIWTVLNPLLMMIILTIVFANLFKVTIENFPVYVLIGQIVFNTNSDATMQGMNAMVHNAALIKKVYIPKYLFPLSNVASCMVNFGFSFVYFTFDNICCWRRR